MCVPVFYLKNEIPVMIGSFGFEPGVNTIFGLPISIDTGANVANVIITRQINTNQQSVSRNDNLNLGLITSITEKMISDQLFEQDEYVSESVCTVNQLVEAITSNQKIFDINLQRSSLISDLNFPQETLQEITQVINAGYHVITHTDSIPYQNWDGVGYIIYNPLNGDASFKISNGGNGEHQELAEGSLMVTAVALGYVDGATSTLPEEVIFSDKLKFFKKTC